MSTATSVPPTVGLEGDDAFETLRATGRRRLLLDAFDRFRAADGFSHARALGFQFTLTLVPALTTVVGLATALDPPAGLGAAFKVAWWPLVRVLLVIALAL